MSRWFRHYAGMMRDDKLVRVSIASKQSIERVVWVWGAILESAAEIDEGGIYDVDPAEIAYFLRAEEIDIRNIINALECMGRISAGSVVKWGNRQFQSDRSASRVAAYRERKRSESDRGNAKSATGNGDVTLQERHCNSPETETETETEEPKGSKARARRVDAFPCPDGVDQIDWDALKANRKAKRAALSEGAYRQITAKLDRWRDQGWPPGPIIAHAAERGWTTVFETDEMKVNGNGRTNRQSGKQGIDQRSSLARAIDEGLDWLGGSQAGIS